MTNNSESKSDVQPKKKGWTKKRILLTFALVVIAIPLVVLVFIALMMAFSGGKNNINSIFLAVDNIRTVGIIIQSVLVFSIIIFWKNLVVFLVKRGLIKPHEYQRAIDFRPNAALLLILYLLLIPIGPGRIWGMIISS